MVDVVVGCLAVVAGLVFCFSGHLWLRLVFPIWGFFVGFSAGAGFVAGLGGDRFLGDVLGWVVGLVVAVVFALLAYFFYAVAVVLAMTSIGFAIGSGLVVALGIDWNWVAVGTGIVVGAVLGVVALVVDMPQFLLTVLSAVAGAIATVAGLMLVFGAMDTADFGDGAFAQQLADDWWWYVVLVALTAAGIGTQLVVAAGVRSSLRAAWDTPPRQRPQPGTPTRAVTRPGHGGADRDQRHQV